MIIDCVGKTVNLITNITPCMQPKKRHDMICKMNCEYMMKYLTNTMGFPMTCGTWGLLDSPCLQQRVADAKTQLNQTHFLIQHPSGVCKEQQRGDSTNQWGRR